MTSLDHNKYRNTGVCPGKVICLVFNYYNDSDNITRILHVAPNPETQGLPADLHPLCLDHADTITVELPSHQPNDKQAGLYTNK
jgi:hypothetical protein